MLPCGRGVDDARADGFQPEARNRGQPALAHRLRGKLARVLNQGECVDTLATGGKRTEGQLVRGGTRGSKNQDFVVRGVFSQERAGAF